jgi:uncharacterized protein (DUF1499 family)
VKAFKRLAIFLVALFVGTWIVVQFMGRNPPPGLGVHDGELSECPDTPNCVCSQCDRADKRPPLEFTGDATAAKNALKTVLSKQGIEVVEEQENYLHAIAVTPIMRFRDDLEFLIQPGEKKIQFRSASRLGKSDLGKNRQRLLEIFAALEKQGIRPGKPNAPGAEKN